MSWPANMGPRTASDPVTEQPSQPSRAAQVPRLRSARSSTASRSPSYGLSLSGKESASRFVGHLHLEPAEGLSSAAGMKRNGRSAKYVFGVWTSIALASAIAGVTGVLLLEDASPQLIALITAIAAGAILANVGRHHDPGGLRTRSLHRLDHRGRIHRGVHDQSGLTPSLGCPSDGSSLTKIGRTAPYFAPELLPGP